MNILLRILSSVKLSLSSHEDKRTKRFQTENTDDGKFDSHV